MSSPWIEDEDEDENVQGWDGTGDGGPDGSGGEVQGTSLPFMDSAVAAELAQDGPPEWMGTRWREIEAEHQWEAWNHLRRWVDWFVPEYRLGTSIVPACWYRHPDVTAELYAAMCMEYKVWEEQAPGLGPMMMWHPHVDMLTSRLRRMVDEAGCTKIGRHKDPEAYGGRAAYELAYDESDWVGWASTERGEVLIERPAAGVKYVRARVVEANGEVVSYSDPVGLGPSALVEAVEARVAVTSSTPSNPRLSVSVASGTDGLGVEWEVSVDGRDWISTEEA